jgi:hypothetical protein
MGPVRDIQLPDYRLAIRKLGRGPNGEDPLIGPDVSGEWTPCLPSRSNQQAWQLSELGRPIDPPLASRALILNVCKEFFCSGEPNSGKGVRFMPDGDSRIKQYRDGSMGKIIEAGDGTQQIHLHSYPGGFTISLYDKRTGSPVPNYDGTPQRFSWPPATPGR